MYGQNEENLKELFERFYDVDKAEQAVEDVEKAEELLRSYPAPEPDDMLIANIKAEIAMRLPVGKAGVFKQIAHKAAPIAAIAAVILVAVSLRLSEKDSGESGRAMYASIIPSAIWDSDDISADDSELAIFTAEVEQIENEVVTLQRGKNDGNGERAVAELEMELTEINSDFWKG